ncbi:serine/threonine-protein kinase [Ramlibacter montanisoli]|uniref:non-specific serine/threonine protein kinase n=1 Tax=Ramlibacter montanisoli TaxID=2732512 RepID=A0A849K629_9BURK|nr:serine/threonine-protein kinase [Ramlibacter montanisoli]NNU43040.1 serine/threonine protein kinase [Ramlibacter montanisoli]
MAALPPPFTHLGRYKVLSELGRGAQGVVYLAEDESLQRQVAIKTLLLPDAAGERRHMEARFLQEAKAAGGLNHPGIITIHDLGREGDWLYIAMELLEGVELRDRMAQGMLALHEAVDIGAQVAAALGAAHARGVVHRDIKPGNIMLLADGHAKIMDFGIARMQKSDVRTQSGTMMGSPKYMSPEQVGGHTIDHRSDIFSLGSMLYEMVAGIPAFSGKNLGHLLNAILHGTPPPPTQFRAGVPAALDEIIARAMQKNPQARYQDASEMARDLAQCRNAIHRPRAAPAAPPPEPSAAPTDPYAATAMDREDVELPDAPPLEGLLPSADFDSSSGLRRLMENGAEVTPVAPQPARKKAWAGWALAYAVAAAGALVIALG